MKKIFKTLILSAVVTVGAVSCNFLEIPLESSVSTSNYYKTTQDFEMSLVGVYNTLLIANDADGMDIRYGTYFNGFLVLGRVGTDEIFAAYGSNGEAELTQYTYTPTNKFLVWTWSAMYRGIQRANVIINRLEPLNGLDGPEKNRILGESHFLRAFFYFHLVRLFENVPIVLDETTDPAKLDVGVKSCKEVYEVITNDLLAAKELLPDSNAGGRPTKLTAAAMLGKVYLQMSGKPLEDNAAAAKAEQELKTVISSGQFGLVDDFFAQFDGHHEHGKEYIWDIEFTNDGTTKYGGLVGTLEGTTTDGDNLYWTQLRTTREFYETFNEKDKRRDCVARFILVHDENGKLQPYYFNPDESPESQGEDWYYFAYKFRHGLTEEERGAGWINWANPINFPIIRYSDVLLMYAEAQLRSKGSADAEALEYVNQVRRRGFGKKGAQILMPNASIDLKSITFDNLLAERSFELAYEGQRWYDLVRFGKLEEKVKSLSKYIVTTAQTSQAEHIQPKHVVYPIPQPAIDASNGAIVQHELWR